MNSLWRRVIRPSYINNYIYKQVSSQRCVHNFMLKNINITSTVVKYPPIMLNSSRFKSKKQHAQDSDDEGDVQSDDSSLSRDSKVVKFNTTTMRTDVILKSALGVARNKIEQVFYESKIRVNGKKILKKSASVKVGDEVDVIKSVSPKNPDHLYVSRVEIINVAATEDNIVVTARRFKNLLIENYEKDPYKSGAVDPDTQ
ncbi:mitochondrial transcription rescue factor 1 [Ostrinia nubilalis]|uniref:uncharacterized protein C6orf203 homolog n=1 Tax=Ostrinia furnacalis TaxID=93504 RepID=UPI00103E671C|nr:uncharacterized protein C6orf203 homolog [Ostrinia furnacalis]